MRQDREKFLLLSKWRWTQTSGPPIQGLNYRKRDSELSLSILGGDLRPAALGFLDRPGVLGGGQSLAARTWESSLRHPRARTSPEPCR